MKAIHRLLMAFAAMSLAAPAQAEEPVRPNILTIVIDDMGWSDIGYMDATIPTPTMDSLQKEGITMSRFYVSPTCTPTRSMFMTGRYNIRNGMQDSVIHASEPRGVPLHEKFVSSCLQEAGYKTAAVGKWHLGMHMDEYLPLNRGFDYHFGFYTGGGSHTKHISVSDFTVRGDSHSSVTVAGKNLWHNGMYSQHNDHTNHTTELFSRATVDFIEQFEEDDTNPWFIYLAYAAIHDPNEVGDPKMITDTICSNIVDMQVRGTDDESWSDRRTKCGMIAELDHGIETIIHGLKEYDEWDDTLIVLFSDNGGVSDGGSINLPLRGQKGEYWEGGVRVPGLMSGPFMSKALQLAEVLPYTSESYVHVTDLMATFLELAGYKSNSEDKTLDGRNQWSYLVNGGEQSGTVDAPRSEVLINLNSPLFAGSGALIVDEYKYIVNPDPQETKIYTRVQSALASMDGDLNTTDIEMVLASVHEHVIGEPEHKLFNIRENPYEKDDMLCGDIVKCGNLYNATGFEDVQAKMLQKWVAYQSDAVASGFKWEDDGPLADPALFDGIWSPWRDGDGVPKALYTGFDSLGYSPGVYKDLISDLTDLATSSVLGETTNPYAVLVTSITAFGLLVGAVAFKMGQNSMQDKTGYLPLR